MPELLDLFARAERDGVDFSFDSYPYRAGMSTLSAQFPGWSQVGDHAERRRRFLDPVARRRIVAAVDRDGSDGHSGLVVDWSTIVIAGVPDGDWTWTVGRSVADAAAQAGTGASEFAIEVLLGTGFSATCVMFIGFEANVRELMRHPRHTVGTDGLLVGARVHPRAWGSFARVLGEYVRRAGVLTLPEAVRHLTSAPADRLRLPDRGRIAEGAFADLVVFDPDTVDSHADYDHPTVPATGVRDVWCNGVRTLQDGKLTSERSGRPLRSGGAGAGG
ncbi:amidohydrolase family protein [Jiangella muralis]|uniref:amidohydrolase family protein n=1 Tax=Jiangella muralis TaxID=702383 RepID=UPI00069F1B22|nr:amidohydrolase family protein [Jiangella muralis]